MVKKVDLSAVVTVHNEGLIAHKTMKSVMTALEKLAIEGYTYEIIVHIDNGDKATLGYFERYKDHEGIRIFTNSFGDTGPSRNFAVKEARGKYVAFMDGDDLISDNWYLEAIKLLEDSKQDIVVHPEAILTFGIGREHVLTIQRESFSIERDTLILMGENRWCAVLMAKRQTLMSIPYRDLGNGYGHEDYVFNVDAMNAGIIHKIAKGTVLFYRRSEHSRLSVGNEQHVTIPYEKAFSFDKVKLIAKKLEQEQKKDSFKARKYRMYKKLRDNDTLNRFITPVAKTVLRIIDKKKKGSRRGKVPTFVIKEWININKTDSQLYPSEKDLHEVSYYRAEDCISVGKAMCKMAKNISHEPNYVFLVPWVARGGADKVLLNYIEALKLIYPTIRITVVATLPVKNAWAKFLPDYVDFVDFGNQTLSLNSDEMDTAFSRLITQLDCPYLHIINSEFAYNWVRRHKDLVKNNYHLNVSLFAWEYIKGSDMKAVYSYDNPYLFDIFDVVEKIFTDNEAIIKYAMDNNGFNNTKFKVHYQPIEDLKLLPVRDGIEKGTKMKVLWAGRVVPVKLPEVLADIGRHVDSKEITIDVYGEMSDGVRQSVFKGIPAIRYCGEYDGFKDLPIQNYDLLLYTSLSDGIPNVILEAAAAGLPIIASNDGGVGEFIVDEKTGLLVYDYLNYQEYVKTLKKAMDNPEKMIIYAGNAQKLLIERHSKDNFIEMVKKDIVIK